MTRRAGLAPPADEADEVPEGWALPKLADVIAINYGKGLPERSRLPGEVTVYGSNGAVGTHNLALTSGPTIVIGRKGTVGAVHFSGVPCWPIDTTYYIEDFAYFHAPFVAYALRTLGLGDMDTSSAIPGLNRERVYDLELRLPPLAEQKRIVAKVEELLARVNAARERLAKVPALLKRFRQAVLAAACSGRLTEEWRVLNPTRQSTEDLLANVERQKSGRLRVKRADASIEALHLSDLPQGWIWIENYRMAVDSSNSICAGPFGTIFKARDFQDSGVPIIFLRHVSAGRYRTEAPGFMDERVWRELHQPYSVYGGELLVTKLGDPPGMACIYPSNAGVAMVTPDVMKMEVNDRIAASDYLMHFFNSPICKELVSTLAFGATRLRIDLSMFKNFPVPLPPLQEQHEIIRRVQALFALADAIEKRVAQATARVEKTTQAILAKAFRGELVPTEAELARQEGRDYEPASVLLDRIRAERAAAPSERPGRTRRTRGAAAPKADAPSPPPTTAAERESAEPRNIPEAILAHLHPDRAYSRAEVCEAVGLTPAEWTWAIRDLKESGRVVQEGERRAARYSIAGRVGKGESA